MSKQEDVYCNLSVHRVEINYSRQCNICELFPDVWLLIWDEKDIKFIAVFGMLSGLS